MAGDLSLKLVIRADGSAAVTELKRLDRSLDASAGAAGRTRQGFDALGGSVARLAAQFAGGLGVAMLTREFLNSAQASERLALGFRAVTGSVGDSRAEMDYIRSTASSLGLEINSAAQAYLSLSAAAKGTALEGQRSRDIFEAVANAMGRLGKSSADTQGALLAIEQMISKGVVSAEELRGQLGERMPGAFQAAARAMGVTTQELGKLLQTGEITAEQMLPQLAAELNKLYDDGQRIGTVTAEWNRFTGEMARSVEEINRVTGATDGLAAALRGATDLAKALTDAMTGTISGGFGVEAGQFSDQIADINNEMVRLSGLAKQFKDAEKSAWTNSGRELAAKQYAGVAAEIASLNRQREQLIALAVEDREVTMAAASARTHEAKATTALADAMKGLQPEFAANLDAMIAAAAKDGITLGIGSGLRSTERQAQLWAEALAKYGSAEIARKWVAPPGKSLHEKGTAADIKATAEGYKWLAENVERFGLALPLANERWHVELTGARATGKAVKETAAAFESVGATEPSLQGLADVVQDMADQYITGEKAARKLAEAQKILSAAVAAGLVSQERASEILAGMTLEMERAAGAAAEAAIKIPSFAELWTETLKELGRSIQGTLADAFTDLFTGTIKTAKDAMQRLKDVILSSLAQLAAALLMRPINVLINGVLGTTAALGSGSAAAGTGLAGGTSGGGMSLGGISTMLSGNQVGQTIGTAIAEGFRYLGTSAPGWANAGLMNLAGTSNLALGAGGLAGGLLGNALFGSQGYGSIGSSIGSTAGAVIGSMILPGIGTIIGGLLGGTGGGFLGSLFGGSKPDAPGLGMQATNGALQVQGGQGEDMDQLVSDTNAALTQVNLFLDEVASLLGAEAISARQSFNAPNALTRPENIEEWVRNTTTDMTSAMVNALPTDEFGEAIRRAWLATAPDVESFAVQAAQVRQLYDALPQIVAQLSAAGFELGDNAGATAIALMQAAGGFDQLMSAQAAYRDLMWTEEEKTAELARELEGAFASLGYAMPATREDLRALIDGLDLSSEAGRTAYVSILSVAGALAQVYTAADASAAALAEAARRLDEIQSSARATLRTVIYDDKEQAKIAAREAAVRANAIAAPITGIDITDYTRATFSAMVKALRSPGGDLVAEAELAAALGENANDYAQAVSDYFQATEALNGALSGQASASSAAASAIDGLADALLAWVRRTRGEVLEMLKPQSLDVTQSQFARQLALAQQGDAKALETITEYADNYLSAARKMSTTRGGYEEVLGYVTARVEGLTRPGRGASDPQVDELARLREESRAADLRLISLTDRMQRYMAILERWEAIGLPAARA